MALDSYRPEVGFPVVTFRVGAAIHLADFNTGKSRFLKDGSVNITGMRTLRDGRTLIAFDNAERHLRVEDVNSGEVVGNLDLAKLFPEMPAVTPRRLDLHEAVDGTLELRINAERNSATRYVYDLTHQRAYTLSPPPGRWDLVAPESGRVLARDQSSPGHLSIVELSEAGPKSQIDHELPPDLELSFISTETHSGGKSFVFGSGSKGFVLYDLEHPALRRVDVDPYSLVSWPMKGILESPNGDLKILSELAAKPGQDRQLAIFGMDSTRQLITIPNSAGLEFKKGAIENSTFPVFRKLRLRDGRILLFGLVTKVDQARREMAAETLYVVDVGTSEVTQLNVSALAAADLDGVRELEDGRIIGIFKVANYRTTKFVQLYGPIPGGR